MLKVALLEKQVVSSVSEELRNLHSYLLVMRGGFKSPRWEPILFGYYFSPLSLVLGHTEHVETRCGQY